MTDLLTRAADPTAEGRLSRPSVVAAAAALAAAFGGLALCAGVAVIGWLASPRGTVADAIRVGADAWLLGHGSGLQLGATRITVVPLGLTLVLGALLWTTASWAGRSSGLGDVRSVCVTTVTLAAGYAAVCTAVAVVAGTEEVSATPLRAFVGALTLGLVFGGTGFASAGGSMGVAVARWPDELRAAILGGAAVVAVLVGAGALLVTASLVADFGAAATVAEALDTGVTGGALLSLLGVLLLPNAALLGTSFLIGPGFMVATGTLVAPSEVTLGRVPALPLLAALPADGVPPWWVMGVVVAPVLAGGVGAAAAVRRFPVLGLDRAALRGGFAGVVGGAATGVLTALAGGAAGPGRMADVGPLVWQCTGVAAVGAGIGGGVVAVVLTWWARHRTSAR